MKLVTVEYPQQNVCQLTLSASAQELEAAAQIVYERVRENYKVKDFEKGEANREQIEADRGEHAFWYDAINDIMDAEVPAIFESAVEENNLNVVSEPTYDLVSVNKEDGFTATATVCLMPTFTFGDYKGIAVSATPTAVTEDQITHYMERKQRLNSALVPHKGPAVKGNTVHITYLGLVDGKPFQGGQAENSELTLGQGRMIPGFEEAIIGHKAGDAFDIEVTFPVNYRAKELAGKPAVFKAKLIDACTKELPAMNCDLVKKLSETATTVEEYREEVRATLKLLRYNNAKNQAKSMVMNELAKLIEAELPEPMVAQAYAAELQQMQQMLQQQGASKAQYLQYLKKTEEQYAEETRAKAARGVRVNLGLLKIAEIEGLVPTREAIDKHLAERAEKTKKSLEDLMQQINYATLTQDMSRKAAAEFVVAQANVTITEPAAPAK